mmetsp:Transcript_12381/g.19049  ORF Transcript_12381/g.19049 Transcript_12381/m.19049 type:complete len:271 (-) Transcript_12381:323-1135(-)
MERFFRLFASFLALSLTIISASSLVSNGFAPPTRTHLPITTRIKQHPQLRLIQRSNEDVYDRTKRQGSWRCYSTNEANDNRDSEDYAKQNIQTVEVTADSLTPSQIKSLSPDSQTSSFWGTLKSFFSNKKNKLSRESLGKLGMSALLAYGFVSNVSGVIAVSSAWFIFCTRTGLSPLAPGQKTAFLGIYAGFTVMLNVIRPARFALSISISPYFERIRKFLQRKFNVSPRGAAVLMIIFINLLGTCSLMCLGVWIASLLSGVPVWGGMIV